jgi:hypothetical protein
VNIPRRVLPIAIVDTHQHESYGRLSVQLCRIAPKRLIDWPANCYRFGVLDMVADPDQAIEPIVLRKRLSASTKKTLPIAIRARNCGQTMLKPAPR